MLLQIAVLGLESDGMVASTEIQPRHVERYTRAGPSIALRLRGTGGLPGLYFKAKSIGKCVAASLDYLKVHILVGCVAFRILHRHFH